MKIGNITFDTPVFLAPMAGYTNLPFRLLCREYGAGAVFTEMISAKGLYYNDKKTEELMRTVDAERPVGIQIFGSEPDILAEVVEKKINPLPFDFLDFNAGCPAPKIVKNGEGSALMKDPEKLYTIVRALKKASRKPVIVKTRLGWDADHINIREVAEKIEVAGADAHTIHGRTREAFYSGKADWEQIAEVKKHASIPIILNGDVNSPEAALKAFETTGCDAVMVGRAAVENPFIFKRIVSCLKQGKYLPAPSVREKTEAILKQTAYIDLLTRKEAAVKEMRKHLAAYTKGLKNAARLRGEVFKVSSQEDIVTLLTDYLRENDELAE